VHVRIIIKKKHIYIYIYIYICTKIFFETKSCHIFKKERRIYSCHKFTQTFYHILNLFICYFSVCTIEEFFKE